VNFVAGAPSATTFSIVASSPTVTADGTSTTMLMMTVEELRDLFRQIVLICLIVRQLCVARDRSAANDRSPRLNS